MAAKNAKGTTTAKKVAVVPKSQLASAPTGKEGKVNPKKPIRGSKKSEIITTMPSVVVGKPLPEVPLPDSRTPLSEATVNRLGKSELRAIAVTRGYWKSSESEHRGGSRMTRAAFLAAQKKDKSLVGKAV